LGLLAQICSNQQLFLAIDHRQEDRIGRMWSRTVRGIKWGNFLYPLQENFFETYRNFGKTPKFKSIKTHGVFCDSLPRYVKRSDTEFRRLTRNEGLGSILNWTLRGKMISFI